MEVSSIQVQTSYNNVYDNSSVKQGSEESNVTSSEQIQQNVETTMDESKKEAMRDELKKLTEELNKEMNPLNTSIQFGIDDDLQELYVSVLDATTNKEIKKIPSDEALELMAKMKEIVGMLFDTKG
jgi:flagellar protein FlaG